jgi:YD repeat-containing protein
VKEMGDTLHKTDSVFDIPFHAYKIAEELKKLPEGLLDTALNHVAAALPQPSLPAATIGSNHLGIPHLHTIPPNCIPSFGPLEIGGCASVLIYGQRAARLGDIGKATCNPIAPFYAVITGSSSVFIGGARAARTLDITKHCGTAGLKLVQLAKKGKFGVLKDLVVFKKKTLKKVAKTLVGLGVGEYLRDEDSSKPLFTRMRATKARVDGDDSLADSLEAVADGQALANSVAQEQAGIDLTHKLISLTVGLMPALPPCYGMLIAAPSSVWIGGIPLPTAGTLIDRATGLTKKLSPVIRDSHRAKKLRALLSGTFKKGRDSNLLDKPLTILTGHPVDVVAGRFVLDAVDVELPGALPLRLARGYSSTWGSRPSPFGRGWSHSLDEAIWHEPGQLVYRTHDGRELELPIVDRETFIPRHRLTLRPFNNNGWQIETQDGLLRDFSPHHQLLKIHDRQGHRIDLEYEDTRLVRAHAPDGREIRFNYDDHGHIAQVHLPDPDTGAPTLHAQYTYEGEDLIKITDALDHTTHYRLDNHKIIEETLPNGLRFHFEYDGPDTDAACTRTRGDGGIIDHSLIYDRPRRTTLVTNSCKEPTIVRHGAHGEPLEISDARGGVTRHEYDEHLRRTATIDPLGRVTRHTYDARGNCTRTVAPGGATTTVEYDRDLPIAATDPAGGRWRWSYDTHGRLVRRTDPLGRTTTYHHTSNTTTITHPGAHRELRTYDLAGRLLRVDLPDGRAQHHTYDRRGRLIRTVHFDGTTETRAYDPNNQLTRHTLPGGDTRHFTHDDLGCLVRVCDASSDLRCTYTGLRWLASVGDASAAPYTIERDLEGRILRIADPTGTLFHAERDPCGQPRAITDHRGRRRIARDARGRILSITHNGSTTTYTRDLADRITQISAPDSTDEFTWRPDGALLTATRSDANGTTLIRRELDACARILREWQDNRWVALTHDLRDRVTHLRSSLGADLRFHHDDRGLARVTVPGTTWAIAHERDRHGRELTRQLPGGLISWWHRDPAGRPLEHGITGSRPPQIHRHRRYTWTLDHRLASDTDLTARPRARAPLAPVSPTCPKDHPTDTPRRDALGRPIARGPLHWQWCGDTPVHTIDPAAPFATWIFSASTPLARLTPTTAHSIVHAPHHPPLIFDADGALTTLPLDLPPSTPPLDIFGRPHTPSIALTLLTRELTPDLDPPKIPPSTHADETTLLAAVFRTPPHP